MVHFGLLQRRDALLSGLPEARAQSGARYVEALPLMLARVRKAASGDWERPSAFLGHNEKSSCSTTDDIDAQRTTHVACSEQWKL